MDFSASRWADWVSFNNNCGDGYKTEYIKNHWIDKNKWEKNKRENTLTKPKKITELYTLNR